MTKRDEMVGIREGRQGPSFLPLLEKIEDNHENGVLVRDRNRLVEKHANQFD
jgi:hypothetical protein